MITPESLKKDVFDAYVKSQEELKILKGASENIDDLHLEKIKELESEVDRLQALVEVNKSDGLTIDENKKESNDIQYQPVVVIPYVKDEAQGQELRWALRGWRKNMPNAKIVVIGDREEWLNIENVLFISCEKIGTNPPLDIVNKLLTVIACEDIPEKFIWANDDQYPVNEILLPDLELLKCSGFLVENVKGAQGKYKANKQATIDILQKLKLPMFDYSTHLPFVFEKSKMKALIEKFELTKKSFLIASLYFNVFFAKAIPLKLDIHADNFKCGVYRSNPNVKFMEKCLKTKKFFNNSFSGFSKVFSDFMEKIFPESCECENENEISKKK